MLKFKAQVSRCVDGDTIDCLINLGFGITTKQRIRLARINTPERGHANYAEALATLSALCLGAEVDVEISNKDPYGRWIAEVKQKEINLSDEMLRLGLAETYA